jgi:hypothetical protein
MPVTRCDKLWRVLLPLIAPILLLLSPSRLHAFPVQTYFVDVNGDGQLEKVELFSQGSQHSIAVHLSRSQVSLYHFEAHTSTFGSVLAGDFDHDGDLDLVWLTGAGPDSVVLRNDGQGNFEFVNNTHSYASELHKLIDGQRKSALRAPRSDVVTCVFSPSDHSKDLTVVQTWHQAGCIFHASLIPSVALSARASPQYRLVGRSPPQLFLIDTSFSS